MIFRMMASVEQTMSFYYVVHMFRFITLENSIECIGLHFHDEEEKEDTIHRSLQATFNKTIHKAQLIII